ncbi:mupirocin-resistant isoleucine--tRNA ligase MupA [Pseudoneobacillus rhizosphaerae]|uniref:Isoleucine--tRNA ligase n=2 Tax=Pseudoneobacillus rhizosphaerae TaxID=2880968 RepID=A0A9C7G7F4_9BACI|nr:isoleucine--tRNA ligase [Pseudoneobacillus rhizosphaerae]CAG9606953.1 mupirocin-resistant isoleucine--tRNA ligase MupA [Pseudoneobacillus rhizosphaerae]
MDVMNLKESNTKREQRVQDYWEQQHIFQRSVQNRETSENFVFYEGPPTANGLPHVGHALGRTIKDIIARYQTMQGKQVIRKAGWDTHGLPVELGVEKALGISGKQAIEEYGVEAFIEKCKESVFSYEKQWRDFTRDLGYWVDMDHPYMTMKNDYIESVWHILGTIHEKGWLYKGHRVSPYCPSCQTSLSSHEVAQGYKDVKDLSATVKFKVKNTENEYVLGWTTTPWTLPANVALAVHADLDYVRVKVDKEIYIVAAARANQVINQYDEILETVKGNSLVGLSYEPPFSFAEVKKGHCIVSAGFVTESSGTGIVHIAPAYGEDDYRLVQENELSFINVVDERGRYLELVTPLAGQLVKESDVAIVKLLHEKGLLFHKERYEHSYPHCWRCDTPLLYYATESWFIKTTALKDEFISKNQQVNWYPEHIKNGRFGNFLEGLVDWNISRNRYWGTPLNVWVCFSCNTECSPKSIGELKQFANETFTEIDLHKPHVDQITFECPSCKEKMHRTPEVIDVWFDSGSMPFAQYHTPFENSDYFNQQFPADVVVEGIDQTRGWFYSLLAVSLLYTGKVPYKNVLATGHVLDEHGQKMSKSKGNALDPVDLIKTFGADSLRWALIEDSAPWNQKRFSKRNVQEAKSKLIDTLTSLYHFYRLYADIDSFDPSTHTSNEYTIMDKWILSRLATTSRLMEKEMNQYQITNAARLGGQLVEEISNWYIRRTRNRFWSEGMSDDKCAAFQSLYTLLINTSKLLAPFIPFTTEEIFYSLKGDSVHLADYPILKEDLINPALEEQMQAVLEIVELGRSIRHAKQLKTKQPLAKLIIISNHLDHHLLAPFEEIIQDELNIKELEWADSSNDFIEHQLKLNFKIAGPKLGKKVNEVNKRLLQASLGEIDLFLTDGTLTLPLDNGETVFLTIEDVLVQKTTSLSGFSEASNRNFTIIMDTNLTKELIKEGIARDFIRIIQDLRKQKDLPVDKRIDLYLSGPVEFLETVTEFEPLIRKGIVLNALHFDITDHSEKIYVGEYEVLVGIL